ncbi:MAG: hypothetical protein ABI599_07830 [Flavobacteriales bacterium]
MLIYFDENLSEHLADGMHHLTLVHLKGVEIISAKRDPGKHTPDDDLLKYIAKKDAVFITKDINIHRDRMMAQMCKELGIAMFFLKLPQNEGKYWDIVRAVIKHWEEMVTIMNTKKRPFAYEVTPKGGPKPLK